MKKILMACLLTSIVFTGCSKSNTDIPTSLEDESEQAQQEQSETQSTTEPVSRNLYYITSNHTQDISGLNAFVDKIKTDGYEFHEITISELPEDAEAVIYNSPEEDMTSEEYAILDNYMNTGGHILILLPASESETRYKYLGRLLEQFYIRLDYDLIIDNANAQDNNYIQIQAINYPDRFVFTDNSMENGIVYLRNSRSFHHMPQGENTHYDSMLQSFETAIGTPWGGIQDDPETYEEENLPVMIYCREEERNNACLIAMGSSDFLLDENYEDTFAKSAQNWAYSAIDWLYNYSRIY
ncbi:MAG: GldG family protein [Oscillospiraceae bacterium]|nr:GldG family protein [Oscillospiraceae bacterium]